MEFSDFRTLVDLAAACITPQTDESVAILLNEIISKYDLKGQVNSIKRILWQEIEAHPRGTVENKKAYVIYKSFDTYIKEQYQAIEDGTLSYGAVDDYLKQILK
jgi:hypothetical protein